jgi:hypothetical protein
MAAELALESKEYVEKTRIDWLELTKSEEV